MSIEAMKLALEALELWVPYAVKLDNECPAIPALMKAIEQAEQAQPVANASAWWALVMGAAAEIEDASNCLRDEDSRRKAISGAKHYRDAANALYTAPPQRQLLIDKMREMLEVQGQHGTWDYDPYMQGMYNGMEYMLAMVEDREPVFREAPEKWLRDRKRQPLTDEEILAVAERCEDSRFSFARAIEAAHGIKREASK